MRRGDAPRGRKELIAWLNGLCNSEYPAVESLRDGAAYCTIVEAAANRIAENYEGLDLPEAATAKEKAAHAAGALGRLDWSATTAVCESNDPSLDSVAVRKTCRENTLILQEIMRNCVPKEHTLEVDVERLCTGKLQDHMRFLQWLYNFMNKTLLQYSKGALGKKALLRHGEVAGVKLNRAQLLLEQKRKTRRAGGQPASRAPSAAAAPSTAVGGGFPQRQAHGTGYGSFVEQQTPRNRAGPSSHAGGPPSTRHADPAYRPAAAMPSASEPAAPFLPPPRLPSSAAPPAGEVAPRTVRDASLSDGGFSHPRTPVVVLGSLKTMLASARREVEELEAVVMSAHEHHLLELTRTSLEEAEGDAAFLASSALQRQLMKAKSGCVETPSLQELGQLLEERDNLAQTFSAVDSIVREFHARNVPSQLLASLCSILYP